MPICWDVQLWLLANWVSAFVVGGSYDPAVLVQHMLKRIAYGRGKCKEHFLTVSYSVWTCR